MERRSGSLIAMHTLELKSEAKQWQEKDSIHVQTTVLYLTSEGVLDGITVRHTEEGMRALLASAKVPMEFWDEITKPQFHITSYMRNRLETHNQFLLTTKRSNHLRNYRLRNLPNLHIYEYGAVKQCHTLARIGSDGK